MIASGGEAEEMEHEVRFAAMVMVAVAGSLVFSRPRLSGSVMFAGRTPWDALTVLVVVLPCASGLSTRSRVVALCLLRWPTLIGWCGTKSLH